MRRDLAPQQENFKESEVLNFTKSDALHANNGYNYYHIGPEFCIIIIIIIRIERFNVA